MMTQPASVSKQIVDAACVAAVIKAASRCNLNCSYCYVYHQGDDGWLRQPAVMAQQTAIAAIDRIATHCRVHAIDHFTFIFHGGEPLLAGVDFFSFFVEQAKRRLAPTTHTSFSLQTNGVPLTREWARRLSALSVKVGISMDGTPASHDRWRVDHRGRGSYARTLAGLVAARAEGLDPGLLTVIDITEDPDAVFDHLVSLQPRIVDFLLPQATWDTPPKRPSPTPYADWLTAIFKRWISSPALPFRIRLFERIIGTVLGFGVNYDALGQGVNATIVIETDGGIESVDVLRVCQNGITHRGFNVFADTIDDALADPLAQSYYFAAERLCAECRACAVNKICAGGYLPHRFSRINGFDNPSVYCADLMRLISIVQDWAIRQLPLDLRAEMHLVSLTDGGVLEAPPAV